MVVAMSLRMFLCLLLCTALGVHAVVRKHQCSCGKILKWSTKASLDASVARCELGHPTEDEFATEDIMTVMGFQVAVVVLTYARNRTSAYQTARRFKKLFAEAGQTCNLAFCFGYDRLRQKGIAGHHVVMQNAHAFWFPKVRDVLAKWQGVNMVWYVEDDISLREGVTLADLYRECWEGILHDRSIFWLGWHTKPRYSVNQQGRRWYQGMGSNLVAFTGDGLTQAYKLMLSKVNHKKTRWVHFDCLLIRHLYDLMHIAPKSLALQRSHMSGVSGVGIVMVIR